MRFDRFVGSMSISFAVFSGSIVLAGDDVCGPGNPPCDEAHETPGCLQPQCCELVCDGDVFCCETVWDEACAEIAIELCGDVQCPEEGDCFEIQETPGCIDESCCELIRMHDPFCGYGVWDVFCVEAAVEWCGLDPTCPLEVPIEAIEEGESCLDRINDGCGRESEEEIQAIPVACGTTIHGKTATTGGPRDVDWFMIDATAGTVLEASIESEFPSRILIVTGDCEGPLRFVSGPSATPCGGPSTWSFTVPNEPWHLVVETGTDGRVLRSGLPCDEEDPENPPDDDEEPDPRVFGLHYLLSVDCVPPCVGDLDGDGTVGGSDLGLLFVAWGACDSTCAADLDGDGTVGGSDLGLLFVAWGDC